MAGPNLRGDILAVCETTPREGGRLPLGRCSAMGQPICRPVWCSASTVAQPQRPQPGSYGGDLPLGTPFLGHMIL